MKEAFYKGLLNGFKGHYNLQMFAEDGEEPNGDNDGGSGNDTDNNINEKKYTDEDEMCIRDSSCSTEDCQSVCDSISVSRKKPRSS